MKRQQFIGLSITSAIASLVFGSLNNIPAVSQTGIDQTAFNNSSLTKHNTYRASHKSPNLVLSNSLKSTAQSWAQNMATKGLFAHSASSQRDGAGENLYVYYTTASSVAVYTLANNAVKSWYDEVSQYNYAQPGFSDDTGHFTQVVWKSSTKLGCGAAQGTKTLNGKRYNAFYVVCHYDPAGNIQGQFPTNVLQP